MSPRKAKRLQAADAARTKSSGRTHVLGILAGGAVITVFGAELARVWKLGTLPRSRQIHSEDESAELVGSGIIIIRMRDFAKQLTTFRSSGPGLGSQLSALVKFGVIFVQQLAQVYLRRGSKKRVAAQG